MPGTIDALIGLPYYARADLAWREVVSHNGASAGSLVPYTCPGEFIDIVTNVFMSCTGDGNPGSRFGALEVVDGSGNLLFFQICEEATNSGTHTQYTWSSSHSARIDLPGFAEINPMPIFQLQAGWFVGAFLENSFPGDMFTELTFEVIHIPTGPEAPVSNGASSVTPVLL